MIRKHLLSSMNFVKFLNLFIFSRIVSYLFPLIGFVLVLLLTLIPTFLKASDQSQIQLTIIAPVFVSLIFTVVQSVYFAILIFKDSESNGLDLVIAAKPIERIDVVLAKYFYFVLYGIVQAIVIFLAFLLGTISLYGIASNSFINTLLIGSFTVSLFAFIFFGLITALIAKKLNRPVAYIFASSVFLPLLLLGNFSGYFSEPTISGFSKNVNNINVLTDNSVPVYNFSTKQQNDSYFVVPSNQAAEFDLDQEQTLNNAFKQSQYTGFASQLLGWVDIPYQMGIVFSDNGTDFLRTRSNIESKRLNEVINYTKNSDIKYNYELVHNQGLISNKDGMPLVPNAPLLAQQKDASSLPRKLIYAWENAGADFLISQDRFEFAKIDDFAGDLDWAIIEQALKNSSISSFLDELNNPIMNDEKITSQGYLDLLYSQMQGLLNTEGVQNIFNNPNNLKTYQRYEQEIYLYVIALYHLYYSNQNSLLLKHVLPQGSSSLNQQYTVKVNVNNEVRNYKIGGYSHFEKTSRTISTVNGGTTTSQSVSRIKLEPSEDYVFRTVNNYFMVKRSSSVIPGYGVAIFWIVLALVLSVSTIYVYYRRDY
ncbi:ABC transporter permease [[Mycoplasma] testudinis]|uniref:ABC transporter permease n=1 Tax=[Mycoplasma] testudinis TaxID=33924 RepID=UPI000480CB16|nr:ABC transporter permease [[Mycoplasma] testudinis]